MGNPSRRARRDAYQTDYQGVVAWMVMDRDLRLANPSYFVGFVGRDFQARR